MMDLIRLAKPWGQTIKNNPIIIWFRRDLRLRDNPALYYAVKTGLPIICIYIHDDEGKSNRKFGEAIKWRLHHSLNSLKNDLREIGGDLLIFKGEHCRVLAELAERLNVRAVYCNRHYEPQNIKTEEKLKTDLSRLSCEFKTFKAGVIVEPWVMSSGSGTPYKVFTPFYKKIMNTGFDTDILPVPSNINAYSFCQTVIASETKQSPCLLVERDCHTRARSFAMTRECNVSDNVSDFYEINDLNLVPKIKWYQGFENKSEIGEKAALSKLDDFLRKSLSGYSQNRDFPSINGTSKLSSHLALGEISPKYIVVKAMDYGLTEGESFIREVFWRDFCYNLLYHFPHITEKPLQTKFEHFEWLENAEHLQAWQIGMTGYPIVDAGMRQLWSEGVMHNRVRMITASFLVKDLRISWQEGEKWFWDCLIDADLASNVANWQWVAGCGADAAPYFRVFNPSLQSKKFDPQGSYIKKYVPELMNMPEKHIHEPWNAPQKILDYCGIKLGKDYPYPILDHAQAKTESLKAFERVKNID